MSVLQAVTLEVCRLQTHTQSPRVCECSEVWMFTRSVDEGSEDVRTATELRSV